MVLKVLGMLFDDGWHPLCFISRSTTERESRLLDPASGEACAVVWALGKLCHYFAGRKLIVLTDHANLQFYSKLSRGDQLGKWGRWAMCMSNYDLDLSTGWRSANNFV